MKAFISALRGWVSRAISSLLSLWKKFRSLPKRTQILSVAGLGVLIVVLFIVLGKGGVAPSTESLRSVTLRSVGELSLGSGSGSIFGTVRSVSEATILSKAGGTVERVHTTLGASVPAGFVIAELENASERAVLLQAQGVYEAALASRGGTDSDGMNTYRSTFTTLDTTVETYVDAFYGEPGTYGPKFLLPVGSDESISFSKTRKDIRARMVVWQENISAGNTEDPGALLADADTTAHIVSDLLVSIAKEANKTGSSASATQLTSLATARTAVDTVLTNIGNARDAYRVGGGSASADASVKQALGTLRLAEANVERTRVRAPIAGTVNYLPIRVGDYVTANTHVATVAQNQALEIIAFVSEDTRDALTVGEEVVVEGTTAGIITSIAPALDPTTKQIEVRIAVNVSTELTNGTSVQIEISSLKTEKDFIAKNSTLSLPLSSVKLRAEDRVIFGIDAESRLVPYLVTTGTVRSDRIEITNPLPLELIIVTDARGLAEGQKVHVAP